MAEPPVHIMRALMLGLGTRKYRETAETLMESMGLSKSSLSEKFVEHSREILEEFLKRRLDDETYVAMFVDGKSLQNQSMVIAIGVTENGVKRALGLTQATTEHSGAIAVMFRDLIARGFDFEKGLLVVIDGGTGLRNAITEVFGSYAIVQRCQVHKIRNVLSHLSESDRETWHRKLMVLFKCEDYNEAQSMVAALHADLLRINVNAARSLNEGIDDMFTLSRLGVHAIFGRCFLSTKPASPLRASIAALPAIHASHHSMDHRRSTHALDCTGVDGARAIMEQHSQFPPIAYGAVGYSKRNQSTTIQTTFRIKAFENFNAKTVMNRAEMI